MEYKKDVVDENSTEAQYIKDEENILKQSAGFYKVLQDYLSNVWHLFEWISIFLIFCCIGTHIADIMNHSEQIARLNVQFTSISIIILSFRLFKTCSNSHLSSSKLIFMFLFRSYCFKEIRHSCHDFILFTYRYWSCICILCRCLVILQ